MSTLQQAQNLARAAELLDRLAHRTRRRAAKVLADGGIDYDRYEEVDDLCDQVNAAARRIDAKVLGLALDGLDEPLEKIADATERLDEVRERIDKAEDVFAIAGRLVVAGLALAGTVLDPSRLSAIAAAKAIADVALAVEAAAG